MAASVIPGESEREMTPRRRPNSSPPAALEDDDLLGEILLRLPPQPSSLPRASLACRHWRRLVRDPGFLRRFRAHHRSRGAAPVLGFFTEGDSGISFHPTMDPPDRVPPERFRLQITGRAENCRIVCCRDGLALLVNVHPGQVLVWDPITGDKCRLRLPLVFRNYDKLYSGMVLRSAAAAVGDGDHFQFQVVLVRCIKGRHARAVACVYSSDTGAWGDLIQISTPLLRTLSLARSGALVGRSLYWLLYGKLTAILEFDLDRQNLAMIPSSYFRGWFMSGEGGGLASVSVSAHTAQIWKRETDSYGIVKWLLTKTIHLDKLLPPLPDGRFATHFAEENNMLIIESIASTSEGIFTVQIESMQVKKLPVNFKELPFLPFSSVYTAEIGVGAEHAGAELLQNR